LLLYVTDTLSPTLIALSCGTFSGKSMDRSHRMS
jgi:hypothetical protein